MNRDIDSLEEYQRFQKDRIRSLRDKLFLLIMLVVAPLVAIAAIVLQMLA